MNELKLLRNNDDKDWDDLAWLNEFFEFLKGGETTGISFRRGYQPKLSSKKAFSIIYYLQEHLPVFPDTIDMCYNCDQLFNTACSGLYWKSKGRHYCEDCEYLVPENYDRDKQKG